ncbi:hypothetical protein FQN50_008367 [Emmonsiellopsis sp. PD_5]|nr:hypothetical protein FQN50_008367 [Emmonsiellopsis sp. PD_5]
MSDFSQYPQPQTLSSRVKSHNKPAEQPATIVRDDEQQQFEDSAAKSRSKLGSFRTIDGAMSISSSYPYPYPKPNAKPARPLISFVRNAWNSADARVSSKLGPTTTTMPSAGRTTWPASIKVLLTLVTAPRFRRYLIVYACLLGLCWVSWAGLLSPRLREHIDLSRALDVRTKEKVGGWFGTNALPKFNDLVYIRSLDPALLPGEQTLAADAPNRKRLIVVGDVHGCVDELQQLLEKASFNSRKGDHLIFTGDLIAKGPKSVEVVELAQKHGASCVRGNNEDRVLLTRRELRTSTSPRNRERSSADKEPDQRDDDVQPDYKERILADSLSDEQAEWLDTCPVMLKVGSITGMGDVVVVHGGLVPGVELERQDPSVVMSMRSIDLLTHVPSSSSKGMSWTKLFNKHQSNLAAARQSAPPGDHARYSAATTVIYGHDSQSSPSIKKYTKGLDTGCVKGGKLSAMIIEDGGKTSVESVKCKDYRSLKR